MGAWQCGMLCSTISVTRAAGGHIVGIIDPVRRACPAQADWKSHGCIRALRGPGCRTRVQFVSEQTDAWTGALIHPAEVCTTQWKLMLNVLLIQDDASGAQVVCDAL